MNDYGCRDVAIGPIPRKTTDSRCISGPRASATFQGAQRVNYNFVEALSIALLAMRRRVTVQGYERIVPPGRLPFMPHLGQTPAS